MLQLDRRRVALATLEWTRTDQGYWRAAGTNGSVYLIHNNTEDGEHRLVYGWNGYGAIDLGTGTRSELTRRAQQLAREGGPPGGPVPEDSDPHRWHEWRSVRGTLRRAGDADELVIDIGYHVLRTSDDHVLYCEYRDGSFAILARGTARTLVPLGDKLAEDDHLRELRPPVTARLGELTIPCRFLDRGKEEKPSKDTKKEDQSKDIDQKKKETKKNPDQKSPPNTDKSQDPPKKNNG